MHKNSEEKNQQRLNLILDTALQLYKEKSLDEVSVLDICRACNMTKPTFYKYLDSKERILVHYYEGTMEDGNGVWEGLAPDSDPATRIMHGFSYSMKKAQKSGRDLYGGYLISCIREQRPVCTCRQSWQEPIKAEIERAKEIGQILNSSSSQIIFNALSDLAAGELFGWVTASDDYSLLEDFTSKAEGIMIMNPEFDWNTVVYSQDSVPLASCNTSGQVN